jgi:hypothetical protein
VKAAVRLVVAYRLRAAEFQGEHQFGLKRYGPWGAGLSMTTCSFHDDFHSDTGKRTQKRTPEASTTTVRCGDPPPASISGRSTGCKRGNGNYTAELPLTAGYLSMFQHCRHPRSKSLKRRAVSAKRHDRFRPTVTDDSR